jgi:hypothetical protein
MQPGPLPAIHRVNCLNPLAVTTKSVGCAHAEEPGAQQQQEQQQQQQPLSQQHLAERFQHWSSIAVKTATLAIAGFVLAVLAASTPGVIVAGFLKASVAAVAYNLVAIAATFCALQTDRFTTCSVHSSAHTSPLRAMHFAVRVPTCYPALSLASSF